jgi:hypothetical protein
MTAAVGIGRMTMMIAPVGTTGIVAVIETIGIVTTGRVVCSAAATVTTTEIGIVTMIAKAVYSAAVRVETMIVTTIGTATANLACSVDVGTEIMIRTIQSKTATHIGVVAMTIAAQVVWAAGRTATGVTTIRTPTAIAILITIGIAALTTMIGTATHAITTTTVTAAAHTMTATTIGIQTVGMTTGTAGIRTMVVTTIGGVMIG